MQSLFFGEWALCWVGLGKIQNLLDISTYAFLSFYKTVVSHHDRLTENCHHFIRFHKVRLRLWSRKRKRNRLLCAWLILQAPISIINFYQSLCNPFTILHNSYTISVLGSPGLISAVVIWRFKRVFCFKGLYQCDTFKKSIFFAFFNSLYVQEYPVKISRPYL